MTIIFFGNTKYSLIGAKIIHKQLGLSYIVTLPDRPDKRGRMQPSPLKIFGLENNIPVMEINKITAETIQKIKTLHPDFFIVEDYGLILPNKLLQIPKYEALNIHHSLLPKYRGSSPAPTALLNGDKITGVSVIKMTAKLDAGDILGQKEYEIKPDDTTDTLLTILNKLGGELIVSILKDFENVKPVAQNESQATYTKKLTKADGYVELNSLEIGNLKLEISRKIRAYYPWPGVWTQLSIKNKELRIKFLPNNLIQMEGKKPVSFKDFINGYPETKEMVEGLFGIQNTTY